MKTLGEFLKEYEELGGTCPVKVCHCHWGSDAWFKCLLSHAMNKCLTREIGRAHV